MHSTRGIQHTLLVGSSLRNITSAGKDGILPTAAGVLSWWKKPSLLQAPDYTRNWWKQRICFIKPTPLRDLCFSGKTWIAHELDVSAFLSPGRDCHISDKGQGQSGLPQRGPAFAFWPLRTGLPALGRCYICESLSRNHRIIKRTEDHPFPKLPFICSYFLCISIVQCCLLEIYYLSRQWVSASINCGHIRWRNNWRKWWLLGNDDCPPRSQLSHPAILLSLTVYFLVVTILFFRGVQRIKVEEWKKGKIDEWS